MTWLIAALLGNALLAALAAGTGRRLIRDRSRAVARAVGAEALHNLSVEMTSSLDLRQVFELIVNQSAAAAGAGEAVLLRASGGGFLIAARVGLDESLPAPDHVATALGHPEPVLLDGGRSLVARVSGGLSGGLVLWMRRSDRAFGRQEVAAVVTILRVGTCAVRNAFQYQEREQQASIDSLTGLYNRREFAGRLDAAIDASRRSCVGFSLVLVDLDQFKAINDAHGHQVGDQALRAAADVLRAAVRTEDLVARLGGDEFALILPGCGLDDAGELAERLLRTVRLAGIPDRQGPQVTLSIGAATYPVQGADAEALMKNADEALYDAKRQGRDRLVACGRFHLVAA